MARVPIQIDRTSSERPLSSRPTWAELDCAALRSNLRRVRRCAAGRRVIAVVKADAYGHGATVMARTLEREGVDALAVATLEEAQILRRAGVGAPILLLEGLHRPEDAREAIALDLVPVVHREDMLAPLEEAARAARTPRSIHLKVDTGMSRLGIRPEALAAALDTLQRCATLRLDGILTHLAESDDASSPITSLQRARFADALALVRGRGLEPTWIHADPSAAVLRGPTLDTTAVRPGLALYGADPTLERSARLEPVMTLRSRVIQATDVPAGTRVGYGGAYVTSRPTRLLTLPIGYADGLPRAAGGRVEVWVDGARAPLAGRVSMDLATVDVGPHSRAGVGSEVTLFGRAGAGVLPVEDLARAVGTIAYEILTGVGARVPRVVRL